MMAVCSFQRNVDAWFHLGVMHLNGLGVKANMQQALAYLNSAANYGHVLAQYNLAMLHLQNSPTDKYDIHHPSGIAGSVCCQLHILSLLHILALEVHFDASVCTCLQRLHNVNHAVTGEGCCRGGCSQALGWLKSIAERGPWAVVLQDALEWVRHAACIYIE